VSALPGWLQTANILFFVIAMYAASAVLRVRAERRMDEMELAAASFGARWGLVIGVAFVVVVTLLPPIQLLFAQMASSFGRTEGNVMPVEARMFLFGVVSTMVAQEASKFVLADSWKWSNDSGPTCS
jgi:hypothetical protein